MSVLNVLIGCEESGKVRDAFLAKGHNAFSCDLLPTRKGNPYTHLQCDIFKAIREAEWDIIILHPPCTHIAVSGNRWYSGTSYRYDAEIWTARLWRAATERAKIGVALENPIGTLPKTILGKPTQYIHPWQFGHPETKKTCLWLHGLPALKPTKIVKPTANRVWKMPPSKTRQRDRSETYSGVAEAMAAQWGSLCE